MQQFDDRDYLLVQNEINFLPAIIEKASARGMKVFLNPSPYNGVIDSLDLGMLNWLIVNEVEAEQITGCREEGAAWEKLHCEYPDLSVLFTLGSAGSKAYCVKSGVVEIVCQNAFPADAVDTTGAGDTYTGYFIGGLMRGLSLRECMCQASMASAISVTRKGAAASVPTVREVMEALETRLK